MKESDKAISEFVELLLQNQVLKFGEFKTKAGRLSPYFMNMGNIASGPSLLKLSTLYWAKIKESFPGVKNLYGPAYKGIPLAVAVSQVFATKGESVNFTFNRKEVKDHGEGGVFVGHDLKAGDKVLIVEDILTGGTSLRESIELLKKKNIEVVGAIIGIDREERGLVNIASIEMAEDYNCPVVALAKISEITNYLTKNEVHGKIWIDSSMEEKINNYRLQYGCAK